MIGNSLLSNSKEMLLVVDSVSSEKGISKEDVFKTLEGSLEVAVRRRYKNSVSIKCVIDRIAGKVDFFSELYVVDSDDGIDSTIAEQYELITTTEAKKLVGSNKAFCDVCNIESGCIIRMPLPPIGSAHTIVQIARNEIVRRMRDIERQKEYDDFKDREGMLISSVVKRVGMKEIMLKIGEYDAMIKVSDTIPGERFYHGDRILACADKVKRMQTGCQIFLSRTSPQFLIELFKREIPEVYDGLINIKAVVREPGSKAKVIVSSRDLHSDVVGACVGVRGSRIHAITKELKGERVDIVEWSDDISVLLENILSPVKVLKVFIDNENDSMEIVVPESFLSLAIGRNGQNSRLVSKIFGMRIDMMSEDTEKLRQKDIAELFSKTLDIDRVVSDLLVTKGYYSIDSIANASVQDLLAIEHFDDDISLEIIERAQASLSDNNNINSEDLLSDNDNIDDSLHDE